MKSLYTVILVLSVLFASCDNSTSTTKKSSSSSTQTTEEKEKKNEGGETSQAKTVYSFAFATKNEDHKVPYTAGGSYPYPVVEKHTPPTDKREITYSSSEEKIAAVDNKGTVTFKTQGTVIITASKDKEGAHKQVSDTYTLYITTKPADKKALADEIKRAMKAHGPRVDLNYIDTSAITDMQDLFMADNSDTPRTEGYGLDAFEGDISKWNVSRVTNMSYMFLGATFNSDISTWDVSAVTNMHGMFYGAIQFNSDISKWNVSAVKDMSFMFHGATAFKQNLNDWGSKINEFIKNNGPWNNTRNMFRDSGIARNLPNWCKNSRCKDLQNE